MSEYSQVRAFNVGVAQDISVEAALIYDDLVYAQRNFGDGWFFRSYEMLLKRFPFYSEQTLRRHIKKLEEGGWISTKVMKVNGKPTCHFQIGRFLSTKLAETMETTKLADSITNNTKTTKISSLFENDQLLLHIISLVNPKEKPTDDRRRQLRGRLKDYSAEDIEGAAIALSQSEWHREHKQMSIDNLLAPSKFGRWFAQRAEGEMSDEERIRTQDQRVKERMG